MEIVGRQQWKQLHGELEEEKTMTVFEWKITDIGNGQYGFIWIAEAGKDDFGSTYKVSVDPKNYDRWIGKCDWLEGNMISNIITSMESPEEHDSISLTQAGTAASSSFGVVSAHPASTASHLVTRRRGSHGSKLDSRKKNATASLPIPRKPRRGASMSTPFRDGFRGKQFHDSADFLSRLSTNGGGRLSA
jgi:hypothetical protein